MKENNNPTPHYEILHEEDIVSPKKILENSDAYLAGIKPKKKPVPHNKKKNPNFPKRGKRDTSIVRIVPAHRLIFENYKAQGFRNMGKAVRKTGVYSETVADRTNVITNTQSWQTLMKQYMPEEHLALRHSEILDKRDYKKVMDDDGNMVEVDNGPNTAAVVKGLELAYRLRGSFNEDKVAPPSTVMYNLFYKPEVREQMKNFEDGLKKTLLNEINKKDIADLKKAEERQSIIDGEIVDED